MRDEFRSRGLPDEQNTLSDEYCCAKIRPGSGFSLVEVVLALGVISFALVAIIGLLPIGLASGRGSIQESRANHLADEIFATLRHNLSPM